MQAGTRSFLRSPIPRSLIQQCQKFEKNLSPYLLKPLVKINSLHLQCIIMFLQIFSSSHFRFLQNFYRIQLTNKWQHWRPKFSFEVYLINYLAVLRRQAINLLSAHVRPDRQRILKDLYVPKSRTRFGRSEKQKRKKVTGL